MASQRATVSGSVVCRFAFIEKAVRGRLHVSFHSGIRVSLLYCEGLRTWGLVDLRAWGLEGLSDDGSRDGARQRIESACARGAHGAAGVGVVLVPRRLEG